MDLIAAALDDRLEPDSRFGACLWSWLRLWPLLLEFLPVHLPEQWAESYKQFNIRLSELLRLSNSGSLSLSLSPSLSQVNEVVTMEIRAVSHFFSNSKARVVVSTFLNLWNLSDSFGAIASYAKVWVDHMFKLMDLDSLPERCAGDGLLGSVRDVEFPPVGCTWCGVFLCIIGQKHTSCTDHTCSFSTMFWTRHAEIWVGALPNPQDPKSRRVLQQDWTWICETEHEGTILIFLSKSNHGKQTKETSRAWVHELPTCNNGHDFGGRRGSQEKWFRRFPRPAQHCRGELGTGSGRAFSNLSLVSFLKKLVPGYLHLFSVNILCIATSCALPPGYRFWINGLFAWHKRHPEMSFHFLQIAMQWFACKQVKLANAGLTLCRSVRNQAIPDLTLSLANGLLAMLHTDMRPQRRLIALNVLNNCQAIYPHFNVELVLELLESVMSWEEQQTRGRARGIAAVMLEAIVTDDEAFVLANRHMTSVVLADLRGNMDEAAAKQQKLIVLLRDRKCAAE